MQMPLLTRERVLRPGREPPTLPTLPSQRNPDSCATQIEAVRTVNIRCVHTYFEGIMVVEAARIIGLTAPHGRSPTRIEPEAIPLLRSLAA
jgi:hypothetical protein